MSTDRITRSLAVLALAMVALTGCDGGMSHEESEGGREYPCNAKAEPNVGQSTSYGVSQGTMGDVGDIRVGLVSTRCDDGVPSARVWLSRGDDEEMDIRIRAGDTFDFYGTRLFVTDVTKHDNNSGDVGIAILN